MRSKQLLPKFTLRKIEAIVGRQVFHELLDEGKGCLEVLEKSLSDTTYQSELVTIIAYMDKVANLHSLPETKFRDITPQGEKIREYEFKSKHLRVYAVQKPGGKVVVLGGFKTTQSADILAMRRLKNQIAESLLKN